MAPRGPAHGVHSKAAQKTIEDLTAEIVAKTTELKQLSQTMINAGEILRAARIATKKEQEKAASIIDTLNLGLGLYAEGMFALTDDEAGNGPVIEWTTQARHISRDEIYAQLMPVLPLLMRFTTALSGARERVFARERHRLAIDASYLADLRDTLTPEQNERLSTIAEGGSLDQPGR